MIRLNKYLSEAGVCSRREADWLIESGVVTVDGKNAVPGMKVEDGQEVCVGKTDKKQDKRQSWRYINPLGLFAQKIKGKRRILSDS